jgi:hypothetical protein
VAIPHDNIGIFIGSSGVVAFLEQFPTPTSITVLAKEHFIDQAWDVVGRKVSKARLLGDIYETARSSIGLPVAIDSPAVTMFRLIIAEGRSLIRQRDAIEQQAHTALADNVDYRRLRQRPADTIAGIHAALAGGQGDRRNDRQPWRGSIISGART